MKKKTTLLTITYFLFGQKSPPNIIFWPWIIDSVPILFEYEQRVEDRFITFKKDMKIYHKKIIEVIERESQMN